METLQFVMHDFKKQLEKGVLQQAYKGLMGYILGLKSHLKNKCPEYTVSGSIYYGFMDMTYFSFTPESLKKRDLKIAIVFNYDAFRFEVWLAGVNKQVGRDYWELIRNSGWNKYRLVSSPKEADGIVEHILVPDPDFSDLDSLTLKIEQGTLSFIGDIEEQLSSL